MPAQTVIKLRRDSAADWTSTNPVLAEGEAGVETDTGLVKYGNGTSTWTALPYPSNSNTTYLVRNNTGITIPKGTLVAATGAEPSGRIDVAPFATTGLQDSELRVMGVATANIASGVNGTVMSFGTLSGLDTRGTAASALAVGDEDWAVGTILFAHPTVAGKLTSVRPKHDLAVAFTTVRHATAGQISVRILPGNKHLEWLHDVELNAPAAGQVLQYNGTDWVNADFEVPPGTTVSTTAPAAPEEGQMWWKSDTGILYIYYDGFWVDAAAGAVGPAGATGATGATGPEGPAGELGGSSYVFVYGNGTAAQNGTELQTAYAAAKLLTPYGAALSNTNRATVVVSPGTYGTTLAVNGQFVNVVSLDGNRSVRLTGINVTADYVHIKGIDVGSATFGGCADLANILIENCAGGNNSFAHAATASGTFINCTGGQYSFGGYFVASGNFIGCTGGNESFGAAGGASGKFTDCIGVGASFGGYGATPGTFTNCIGGNGSFGGFGGTASGTFTNCTGGSASFGGDFGFANGTYVNCVGGTESFGGGAGVNSPGKVLYCRLSSGSFSPPDGGKIRLSLDGSLTVINLG